MSVPKAQISLICSFVIFNNCLVNIYRNMYEGEGSPSSTENKGLQKRIS